MKGAGKYKTQSADSKIDIMKGTEKRKDVEPTKAVATEALENEYELINLKIDIESFLMG